MSNLLDTLGGGLRPPPDDRHAPDGAFLPASPSIRIARAKPALEQRHVESVVGGLCEASEVVLPFDGQE